jgi:hypothetical protein
VLVYCYLFALLLIAVAIAAAAIDAMRYPQPHPESGELVVVYRRQRPRSVRLSVLWGLVEYRRD